MADYDPPREIVPIFNPVDWIPFGDDPLTVGEGDGRYLKLTGGTERGPVVFNQDITIKEDINFTDGTNTYSIGIEPTGELLIDGTGELHITTDGVNMQGESINMTGGRIHNIPLIEGQNNVNLVVEGKGNGAIVLKTGTQDRVIVNGNGNVSIDSETLYVDATSNRVGLGTFLPSEQLHVVGNIQADSNVFISQDLQVNSYSQLLGDVDIGGYCQIQNYCSVVNDFTVDGGTLHVDSTNNRIGIGTLTPEQALHIKDGNLFVEGPNANLYIGNDADSETPRLRLFVSSVDSYLDFGNATLFIRSGTTGPTPTVERARITSTVFRTSVPMESQSGSTNTFNNTTNAVEVVPAQFTASNIDTGRSTTVRIGKNTNAPYNTAQLIHFYNGNASNLNRLDLGFFGIGARLSVRGDGRVGIGTTSPSQLLDVNGGNIRCSGSIVSEAWVSGQIVQMVNWNPDNANPSQYVFNSGTYATWVSVSFTPKSTNSRIIVQADASYIIGGNDADDFKVRVLDAGNQRFEKVQLFRNATGGGTRSGVLLPLHCSYGNTTTTARNIEIQFARGTADDDITLTASADQNWSLTITEIQV